MALPTSGALSLNDIKGEFGGPSSPSLGDYYAGGSYVKAGTSGTYGAVPSSGAISIQNFYGTAAPVISLSDYSGYASTSTPSTATNGFQLNSTGKVYVNTNGSYTYLQDWVTPNSAASDYECYVTVSSGTLSSGTTGAWIALSTTRDWTVVKAPPLGSKTCTFTIDIRKIGTTTVLKTATIDITAEVTL